MHDLVRLYAQQLSDTHANADGRGEAIDRLLTWYPNTAGAADDTCGRCLEQPSRRNSLIGMMPWRGWTPSGLP